MKIIYLITGLHTGGAELVLLSLAKGLNKTCYETAVYSLLPIGEVGMRMQQEGIRVESLGVRMKYDPLIFFRLIATLRRERPDILHTFLFHANLLGRIAGRLAGVPIIISSIHNEYFGGFWREQLLRWTDRFCTITTIVSQRAADRMMRLRIVPKKKLRVIYNGIDTEKFMPGDAQMTLESLGIHGSPVLVSVGRLTKQKGYPYLLEAAAKLKESWPNFVWLVLGEGSERKALVEKTAALGLTEHVRFLGTKENVIDYLRLADIFVLASLWEGLGNVVLEAMACELPVVATNVGGVSEIIEDGVSGFLVPPKNAGALAQKIQYVLQLPDSERRKIGKAARERIVEHFSLSGMVSAYEELYAEFSRQ